MLVEKTPNHLPYVAAIKLITGEEIIAKVISEDGGYHLVSPLSMIMAENPDNPQQTRVMFTPWMVAADDKPIVVIKSHMLAITEARSDAREQYEAATSAN
jgi:hypothetical protein